MSPQNSYSPIIEYPCKLFNHPPYFSNMSLIKILSPSYYPMVTLNLSVQAPKPARQTRNSVDIPSLWSNPNPMAVVVFGQLHFSPLPGSSAAFPRCSCTICVFVCLPFACETLILVLSFLHSTTLRSNFGLFKKSYIVTNVILFAYVENVSCSCHGFHLSDINAIK